MHLARFDESRSCNCDMGAKSRSASMSWACTLTGQPAQTWPTMGFQMFDLVRWTSHFILKSSSGDCSSNLAYVVAFWISFKAVMFLWSVERKAERNICTEITSPTVNLSYLYQLYFGSTLLHFRGLHKCWKMLLSLRINCFDDISQFSIYVFLLFAYLLYVRLHRSYFMS